MSMPMPESSGMMEESEQATEGDSNYDATSPIPGIDTSGDTNMKAGMLGGISTPTMNPENGSQGYEQVVDIGSSVPDSAGMGMGTGEAAKGTPATASGSGGGLKRMNPSPYGSETE